MISLDVEIRQFARGSRRIGPAFARSVLLDVGALKVSRSESETAGGWCPPTVSSDPLAIEAPVGPAER